MGPDGLCGVGGITLALGGDGGGILGWSLRGVDRPEVDGIAVLPVLPPAADVPDDVPRDAHRNGVLAVDHLVLVTPHLARTVAALRDIGLDPRRERDGELGGRAVRQVFFRMGTILEVVGSPDVEGEGPASLWGITFVVDDIDASAAFFAEHASPVKDAVQPGRRITTLRHRELGLSVRTALITPHHRSSEH